MPSITSIINSLLRVLPDSGGHEIYKSISQLYPKSQNLATRDSVSESFRFQLQGWHTRLAFNACRNWHWPYWMNVANCVSGPGCMSPQIESPFLNSVSTDAIPIPGSPSGFYGTIDPRAMLVPSHNQFALETWVLVDGQLICPSEEMDSSLFSYALDPSHINIIMSHSQFTLEVSASGLDVDGASMIHLHGRLTPTGESSQCSLAYAIRPYNMQSVVLLKDLVYNSRGFWMSESRIVAWSLQKPELAWAGNADHGDSYLFLAHPPERTATRCKAGLANCLNIFAPDNSGTSNFDLIIPTEPSPSRHFPFVHLPSVIKQRKSSPPATPSNGNDNQQFTGNVVLPILTDVSSPTIRDLLNKNPHSLFSVVKTLCDNSQTKEAASVLNYILLSLQKNGEMLYAHGHWEVYGQLLTALEAYHTAVSPQQSASVLAYSQVRALARWLIRKRREIVHAPAKPKGLLPPGITRSDLGTDYNVVDNLWAIEGLYAASHMALQYHEPRDAELFRKEAEVFTSRLQAAINRELEYSVNTLLPGRFYRSFETVAAAELLDIEHLHHCGPAFRSTDWYRRLATYLASRVPNCETAAGCFMRNIDTGGFSPARRILLQQYFLTENPAVAKELNEELVLLKNHTGLWSSTVQPVTGRGLGKSFVDPETTSLVAQLVKKQNNKAESNNPQN